MFVQALSVRYEDSFFFAKKSYPDKASMHDQRRSPTGFNYYSEQAYSKKNCTIISINTNIIILILFFSVVLSIKIQPSSLISIYFFLHQLSTLLINHLVYMYTYDKEIAIDIQASIFFRDDLLKKKFLIDVKVLFCLYISASVHSRTTYHLSVFLSTGRTCSCHFVRIRLPIGIFTVT
jgi:hypothetical protein